MTHLRWLALSMLIASGPSAAQMPSTEEMARATAATEAQARQAGVVLRNGTLWLAALRERAPLVAAYGGGVCQMGYSAYTPGRDYRWLFPSLNADQRALWLAGVVHHELAHCVEQAAAGTPAGTEHALAEGAPGQRWREVLADLAFALHVDQPGPQGDRLVRLMASLRARQGALDPSHDTSAELQCYLRDRDRFAPAGPWLARLQAWRYRCWQAPLPPVPPGATAGPSP
jgi:hypothetical protein